MKWFCIFLLSMSTLVRAQDDETEDRLANIDTVIQLIENERIAELAKRIDYPLERPGPVPDITNEREFILYYPVMFDSSFRAKLTSTEYTSENIINRWEYGILNGEIWFDYRGRIITVNYNSEREMELYYQLMAETKSIAHDTLDDWRANEVELMSDRYYVRVDLLPNSELRYAAWNNPKTISDTPDMITIGGTSEVQGTMGGIIYRFPRGNFEYLVSRVDAAESEEDLGWWVIVYRDGKEIMKHKMHPVR